MSTLEIIEVCVVAALIVAAVIYSIVVLAKNGGFKKLYATIVEAVNEAEKLYPTSGSGAKKKAYVLEKVKEKCAELGVPYGLIEKLVSWEIDKLIAASKVDVNNGGSTTPSTGSEEKESSEEKLKIAE